MTTLRIRKELKALAVEEAGIHYFDVSDPRSGSSMRLYDFEWLIAERIDGGASSDEVASWAHARFGFTPTVADLRAFEVRLGDLGFTDRTEAPAHSGSAPAIVAEPFVPARAPDEDEGPEVEITAEAEAEPENAPESAKESAPESAKESAAPAPTPTAAPKEEPASEPAHVEAPVPVPPAPLPVAVVAAKAPDPVTLPPTPFTPPPPVAPVAPVAAAGDRSTVELAAPAGSTAPAESPAPVATAAAKAGSKNLVVVLALFVLSAGCFLAYTYVIKPGLEPAHVTVQTAPAARELLRQYEGGKAQVIRGEPTSLSFAEAGKIADVLPAGSDVKEGAPVASLEAAAPLEKELADVKDREGFYATQLKAAQAKNNPAEVKKNEEKLAEKRKRLAEIEERLKRLKIFAPASGSIAKALVAAGGTVKEGEPVVEMTGKGMVVEFSLLAQEAVSIKVADAVQIAPQTGSNTVAQGRVVNVNGSAVKVELLDDAGGTVKAGDTVGLVRSREPNLIKLPLNSVGKSDTGIDQVLVLQEGVIHAKTVKVFERTATEVYISGGISTGDKVVTGGLDTLKEGQKAVAD